MRSHPLLVETDWLEANLDNPSLRVVDATVALQFDPETGETVVKSGSKLWSEGHIPGSVFADLIEMSPADRSLPSAETFSVAMSELGIGSGTYVVIYDHGMTMWATRLWWMLAVYGFDAVSLLNGGWKAWNDGTRPISTEPAEYTKADFEPKFRPELFVSTQEVESLDTDETTLINALSPEMFRGEQKVGYRRPGRIPGSVNVPYYELLNSETGRFLELEQMRDRFSEAGVSEDGRVVTYCGGGIAATTDAFGLALLGQDEVAVYDGSLTEWTADSDRPVEIG